MAKKHSKRDRRDIAIQDYLTKSLDTFIQERPDSALQLGWLECLLEMARTFGGCPVSYAMAHALAAATKPTLAEQE